MDSGCRCPVFCTADIPAATLNLLLQFVEEYISEFLDDPTLSMQVSDLIVIMGTNDITTITEGSSSPVTSSPTAFLDHTLQQVQEWFEINITQPFTKGFTSHCFLVLDNKTTEDDSCIFVSTLDSAPGEIHSLRCNFDVAMINVTSCDIQGESIEEGATGNFMRSGVTMTRENLRLVTNGGIYIENGEVMIDEAWRNFHNW
ncbi:hypothetical protein CPB84DRAFT_1780012 [Gymnopilus junonius]|uniref:Uncharacterized protein n=1 Tax=Gymnopilus junonius TaxID=109634 RepID=A0A9P5TMN4_GYMJU|nr:hypothetical protein CPB84DRAFT_1780012 [Gymnopilus junonius]